jgi:hypothetical protein
MVIFLSASCNAAVSSSSSKSVCSQQSWRHGKSRSDDDDDDDDDVDDDDDDSKSLRALEKSSFCSAAKRDLQSSRGEEVIEGMGGMMRRWRGNKCISIAILAINE